MGAPTGRLSAFIEVPFDDGDKKLRPDGLIQVVSGHRTWTALVEVKTGRHDLPRPDRVLPGRGARGSMAMAKPEPWLRRAMTRSHLLRVTATAIATAWIGYRHRTRPSQRGSSTTPPELHAWTDHVSQSAFSYDVRLLYGVRQVALAGAAGGHGGRWLVGENQKTMRGPSCRDGCFTPRAVTTGGPGRSGPGSGSSPGRSAGAGSTAVVRRLGRGDWTGRTSWTSR